MQKAWGH